MMGQYTDTGRCRVIRRDSPGGAAKLRTRGEVPIYLFIYLLLKIAHKIHKKLHATTQ